MMFIWEIFNLMCLWDVSQAVGNVWVGWVSLIVGTYLRSDSNYCDDSQCECEMGTCPCADTFIHMVSGATVQGYRCNFGSH